MNSFRHEATVIWVQTAVVVAAIELLTPPWWAWIYVAGLVGLAAMDTRDEWVRQQAFKRHLPH